MSNQQQNQPKNILIKSPAIVFDLPKEQASIIKVIGVGGGGSNAVNHMFKQGIRGVNFVICNTDAQAMELSNVPNKIQLGPELTSGLGAGSNPDVGRKATEESLEEIRAILEKNTKMVFVTAGMGGGTGTGGAPVIARLAKEMGILTVGIVTTPFFFEGKRKMNQAREGIEEMRQHVDSIIVISNDKIREIYGNLTKSEAFAKADNILAIAARSISEIITVPGQINVDFADVRYVMSNSGLAIMGSATAEGKDRAIRAVQDALASPLLNDNDIRGAKKILLNITSGKQQVTIDEITEIHEYVLEMAGPETDVIFGTCDDESLDDKLTVTIIATGFEEKGVCADTDHQKLTSKSKDENPLIFKPKPPAIEQNIISEQQSTEHQVTLKNSMTESADCEKSLTEESNNPPDAKLKDEPEWELPFVIVPKENQGASSTPPPDPEEKEYVRKRGEILMNRSHNYKDMENEPAYKRRNIRLSGAPHSSESEMSRLAVGDHEPQGGGRIYRGNSFLHDNVD
ncbi:MAG: hypothetical protein KatS3mg031_1781 [Chitinophagales bacterium]|nr:MAG: hypothetical protein KatS3mg031_1781 [Chitinophagales bacterium]